MFREQTWSSTALVFSVNLEVIAMQSCASNVRPSLPVPLPERFFTALLLPCQVFRKKMIHFLQSSSAHGSGSNFKVAAALTDSLVIRSGFFRCERPSHALPFHLYLSRCENLQFSHQVNNAAAGIQIGVQVT